MRNVDKLKNMDEIHQLILQSVRKSDLFENFWLREFVTIVLDMFIHKNDGLQFFVDYYNTTEEDFDLYFRDTLTKIFDEETYDELKKGLGEKK